MKDLFLLPPLRSLTLSTTPLASTLSLATLPLHAHEILFSFTFYTLTSTTLSPVLSARLFPKTYRALSPKSKINWDIHVTSFVQSVLVCGVALWVIVNDTERAAMDWRGRIWGYTGSVGMVQGMAAGYFLWDLGISLVYFDICGVASLFHAISALLVTCLGFRPFANYYGLNFILYELSTPFLNIHWFCDKLGLTGSTFQLINAGFLLTTFCGCRCIWGTYQSGWIYNDIFKALSLTDAEKPLAVTAGMSQGQAYDILSGGGVGDHSVPWWLAGLYLGSNTLLSVLQFYWFGKMIQAVRKRFQVPKGNEKKIGGPRKENGDSQKKS